MLYLHSNSKLKSDLFHCDMLYRILLAIRIKWSFLIRVNIFKNYISIHTFIYVFSRTKISFDQTWWFDGKFDYALYKTYIWLHNIIYNIQLA